ncbi:hypothetical protein L208DRAFT_1376593 [Tricholoma matsutake]|nr:hypothetical protein L208DRAFT_1376593 [Tricholoma matsutake 945]
MYSAQLLIANPILQHLKAMTNLMQSSCPLNDGDRFPQICHACNFGPGGMSSIGPLITRNLDGPGVHVIMAGEQQGIVRVHWNQNMRTGGIRSGHLVSFSLVMVWTHILTIMAARMTPSIVKAGFISNVLIAGFYIKLAGGGHHTPHVKATEIRRKFLLAWVLLEHRPLSVQLPVECLHVDDGIPTVEKIVGIIEGLKAEGIRHIAFKPSSIDEVVNIAASPDFCKIMQLEVFVLASLI